MSYIYWYLPPYISYLSSWCSFYRKKECQWRYLLISGISRYLRTPLPPWWVEGGLADYTADEQTDICPNTTLCHAALKYTNKQITNKQISQTNRYRKQTDINPIPNSAMLHWNTQTNRSQTKRRVLIPYSATLYSVLNYTNKLITNKETGVISPCSVVLLSGAHWNWL